MPLAAFTKTFKLDPSKFKKGFFPHFFNTAENLKHHVGDIPDVQYFGPSSMSISKCNEFMEWHAKQRKDIREGKFKYNLKNEMHDYCVSDVKLLKEGCNSFRTAMTSVTGIDPFAYVTIAAVAMAVFRRNFLTDGEIVRDRNCVRTSAFSRKRMEWFRNRVNENGEELVLCDDDLDPHSDDPYIACFGNNESVSKNAIATLRGVNNLITPPKFESGSKRSNGERSSAIYNRLAFGYKNGVLTTAYHYMSDYYNGNLSLFHPYSKIRFHGIRMLDANNEGNRFERRLKEYFGNCKLEKIWHSEWLQKSKNQKPFIDDPSLNTLPLSPRDAFFGGRTGAVKLKYTFDSANGEYGRYDDVCSLYPTVNYYDPYPIGLPKRMLRLPDNTWRVIYRDGDSAILPEDHNDVENVNTLFGFIKCTVTCPDDLYHPVLPTRGENGKLLFDLVSPKTGTWTSMELKLALEKGYTLENVYEMWHYESSQSLFKDYVRTFIALKTAASGFPDGVDTEEAKMQHRNEFKSKYGIDLPEVEKNAGKRAVAKLLLNSLWGKFAQRNNMTKKRIVYSNRELMDHLNKPHYDIVSVNPLDDISAEINYKINEEHMVNCSVLTSVTNIAIAAFTTSHARCRLYQALDFLGEQVLYFDTDSVIYSVYPESAGSVSQGKTKILPIGTDLGEWTDELDGGRLSGTFYSSGPKSYSYIVEDKWGAEKVVTKVKGFTLNKRNSEVINYEGMRKIVEGMGRYKLSTRNPHRIRIKKSSSTPAVKCVEEKVMSFTFSKRFILTTSSPKTDRLLDTLPFGHRKIALHKEAVQRFPPVYTITGKRSVEENINFETHGENSHSLSLSLSHSLSLNSQSSSNDGSEDGFEIIN
jgi:hypothetical protein